MQLEAPRGWPAPRGPECASDLALDRRRLGELPAEDLRALEAHLGTCSACRARAAHVDAPLPWPAADRDAVVQRIADQARPSGGSAAAFFRPRRQTMGIAAIALSALLALWLLPKREDRVSLKGALTLAVYRERGGEVIRAKKGDVLAPGDRLRFEVGLPFEGHLRILGVEASGRLYAVVPLDRAAPPIAVTPSGGAQLLDSAVELDGSRGQETLFAVLCPVAFGVDDLAVKGAELVVPAECRSTSFDFEKRP